MGEAPTASARVHARPSWRSARSFRRRPCGWPTSIPEPERCRQSPRASCRPYAGHMRGVLYESPRRRNTRAADYLCRLCKESPAAAWDHCHDHGYVRGPLTELTREFLQVRRLLH
ncbi:endonuclease domain-containing protein [Streptomyces sp. NPDC012466]|uniref:endonuclease domain-containing protein n=2 Tax=Streptomyces TaxID=1883 RepID=UPI0036E546C5